VKRILLAALMLMSAGVVSTASTAASGETLRVCAGVKAKSPTAASILEAGRPTFRWTAEPGTTARREVVVVTLPAGTSQTFPADRPYRLHAGKALGTGAYSWFAVFYNAEGKALCRSPLIAFSVVLAKPGHGVADNSIFGPQFTANPVVAAVIIVNNRVVIVLQNSPYTGPRDVNVAANDFDGTGYVLPTGKVGLEIHGNDLANHLTGSSGSDILFGYGGNDTLIDSTGDDTAFGGPGDDQLVDSAATTGDTDEWFGGPGADQGTLSDGDGNDTIHIAAGDFGTDDSGDQVVPDDTSP
jgi:hypothetical protein